MKANTVFKCILIVLFAGFSVVTKAQATLAKDTKIMNFNIVQNKSKVLINWSTDKKDAANYFTVERSEDGKNFKTVAYVLGADPAKPDGDCFGCFDKISTNSGKYYYRLKHVGLDGSVELSDIKMLAVK